MVSHMATDPSANLPTMIRRALGQRCPRCAATGIFHGWGELSEWCPGCGFGFEREPGYFVGAMIINTVVTVGLVMGTLVIGAILTWPNVPWTIVGVATLAIGGGIPIWFYPRSKMLWMAIELSYHPLEDQERLAAIERMNER